MCGKKQNHPSIYRRAKAALAAAVMAWAAVQVVAVVALAAVVASAAEAVALEVVSSVQVASDQMVVAVKAFNVKLEFFDFFVIYIFWKCHQKFKNSSTTDRNYVTRYSL